MLWTSARHAWDHLPTCFNLHEQTEKAEAEACLADEWARGDYMYLHT